MTIPVTLPRSSLEYKSQQEALDSLLELRRKECLSITQQHHSQLNNIPHFIDSNCFIFPVLYDLLERDPYFKDKLSSGFVPLYFRFSYLRLNNCKHYSLINSVILEQEKPLEWYSPPQTLQASSFSENDWEHFTFEVCVRNNPDDMVSYNLKNAKAMIRYQIDQKIKQAKKNLKYYCENCKKKNCKLYEYYNEVSLKGILDKYLTETNNELNGSWLEFHQENALISLLCRRCNLVKLVTEGSTKPKFDTSKK